MSELPSPPGEQARRTLRHADIPWDAEVDDPREVAWVVHDHQGLLGGLAAAFSTGCRSLCRAEDFFADLGLGARLWYVCQTTTDHRGDIVTVEQRYFVTAIPAGALTRDLELALVRMHWAIENCCHWTLDVMLGEDEGHPCQATRASIETVSWLKLIGYNAVSAWRHLAPRKDRKPMAWVRAMETLRDALLVALVVDHREFAQAVT